VNTIGSVLSRARKKLREMAKKTAEVRTVKAKKAKPPDGNAGNKSSKDKAP
jgi:hypothetical protein